MVRPILSRRTVVIGLLGLLGGCIGLSPNQSTPTADSTNPAQGDVSQIGELSLTSPAFEDGGPIPAEYGHSQRNVNPPLTISGTPAETESFTLIMDDPDAVGPAGKVWLHWLVWNIPPGVTEISEGWNPTDAIQGTNDFGDRGYGGPDPPDSVHTYRFKLFALDALLDVSADATKEALGRSMVDHVVAQTQLEGTYAP